MQSSVIKRIQESHRKGSMCNSRVDLRARDRAKRVEALRDEDGSPIREPLLFFEDSVESASNAKSCNDQDTTSLYLWYPPAVPSPDSYVLLKFYECTAGLLKRYFSVRQEDKDGTYISGDFPFRLSPTEHQVCNINPSNSCSLLVLGRSGTG